MYYNFVCKDKGRNTTIIKYDVDTNNFIIDNSEVFKSTDQVSKYINYNNDRVTSLRLSLGFNCNFKCKYCLQHGITHIQSLVPKKRIVTQCLYNYPNLSNIQFWGGEGLVYFKDIQEFYELFEQTKPSTQQFDYSIVTNGSLFKGSIFDWLYEHNFNIVISHDAQGTVYRSMDILEDTEIRNNIIKYHEKYPDKIFVSCVISNKNYSYPDLKEYFYNKLGFEIRLVDTPVIDVTHKIALECAMTEEQAQQYFKSACFYLYKKLMNNEEIYDSLIQHAQHFIRGMQNRLTDISSSTRCFVSSNDTVTIDTYGNILICQSDSYDTIVHNESAKLGDIFTNTKVLPKAKLEYLHTKQITQCNNCIGKFICRGGCPNEVEEFRDYNCMVSKYQSIAIISLAIFMMFHVVSVEVKSDELSN